ncbi:LemA family protein [Nostoc sp.]|uniref:LemA family protein n=1 Tax=Nostoc sp. TaxID=1180 RepID=UPI003FA58841
MPRLATLAQIAYTFEQKILIKSSGLRRRATFKILSDNSRMAVKDQISRMLTKIIVVVEAYPELKTKQTTILSNYNII